MQEKSVKNAVFAIFLMASMVAYGYHSSTLIEKFLTKPVFTEIRRASSPFEMPEIVMCNAAPLVEGHWTTNDRFDELMATHNASNFVPNSPTHIALWPKGMESSIMATWKDNDFMKEVGGMTFEEFVLACDYDGVNCLSREHFQLVVTPEWQNCFKIDLQNKSSHLKDIRFILWTNTSSGFFVSNRNMYGARIHIRPKKTSPHAGHWIELGPGLETKLKIRQSNIHLENMRTKPCQKEHSHVYYHHLNGRTVERYNYRTEDCHIQRYYNAFAKECGCLPYHHMTQKLYEQYPFCFDLLDHRNKKNSFLTTSYCIDKMVERKSRILQEVSDAECPPSCVTQHYEADVTSILWEPFHDNELSQSIYGAWAKQSKLNLNYTAIKDLRQTFIRKTGKQMFLNDKEIANYTDKDVRTKLELMDYGKSFQKYFVRLNIQLDSKTTDVTEYPAYEIFQLLSDLAGISGMYLGISVLTLFELFTFIFKMRLCCRKTPEESRNGHVAGEESAEAAV